MVAMTEVAVVGFAQSAVVRRGETTTSGAERLGPIFGEVLAAPGLAKGDIGFWCSGSSDSLAGRAFSFVQAVDAIGAFPPIMESHVEMDAVSLDRTTTRLNSSHIPLYRM